jgi:peptidoglycan/LPS O-acetylase OafA/YrhL
MKVQSIDESISRHLNNFDFLRFSAAIFVMFGHSYRLLNLTSEEPLTRLAGGGLYFGGVGVYIFFIISGFLVLSSWKRNSHFINLFKNRVLRIIPALIVVVFGTVFILGPLVTTLSLKEYFLNADTWRYLLSISIYQIYYSLPGVFENNLFKYAVNGSLWTLPVEFSLYIFLVILGLIGAYKKRITIVFLFLLLFILVTFQQSLLTKIFIPYLGDGLQIAQLSLFFFAGMIFFLYRERIIFDWRILLILILIWTASFQSIYLMTISFFCLPYFIMYFAFFNNKILNSFGKYGDFSYGIYIIAFPIQQTIIYIFNNDIHPITLFVLALSVTLPLSVLSWYNIERPALNLKKKC